MQQAFIIHLSVNGHQGWIHCIAIVNRAINADVLFSKMTSQEKQPACEPHLSLCLWRDTDRKAL